MQKACCDTQVAVGSLNPKDLKLALIGNPNAGKTTLFNTLTGARQRTGNWPGVTVERKEGLCRLGELDTQVIDLPGTYSLDLSDASADEQIARQFVLENPDYLFLNIVDASTLERGLYLTLQLRELGVPLIVLLNMMDIAEKRGMKIKPCELEQQLGCPVLALSLRQDKDLNAVYNIITSYQAAPSPLPIQYQTAVEAAIGELQNQQQLSRLPALINLQNSNEPLVTDLHKTIEVETGEPLDFLLADARFDAATRLAQKVVHEQ
ncbi:MAG TPA: FeoB small GTPase domain-containing protein, partial [Thiolinea sp.]|nr:FeoB small GTPase domain-containing protein [Thiolinea sp.]